MTRAEPKKVAVLAVVAIGACGYLALSVFGLGGKLASPRSVAEAAASEQRRDSTAGLRLVGDPFSHTELLRKKKEAQTASKTVMLGGATPGPVPAANQFVRPWGTPIPLPGTLNVNPAETSPENVKPAEIAGNTRPKGEEIRFSVRLSAVVNVNRAVAFLSVSGKESRAYGVGDSIAPGWRLLVIEESEVLIVGKKDVKRLAVGQEATL